MILGIDEVGRGPWAGPLVVGAVVLGGVEIEGLTDSKKLAKKRREELALKIHQSASVGLGWVSAKELDEIGMSGALELATRRAVERIITPYHEIIIDGTINFLKNTSKGKFVTTLPKADLLIPSVSAASIVAKVARDAYMTEQDNVYPGYNFSSHSGYGVKKHREAIERLGVTPLHRLSFKPLHAYAHERDTRGVGPDIYRDEITTRAIGNESELLVSRHLVEHGHNILAQNWRTKWCEIDIISALADTLYFTEVKHRKDDRAGDGFSAITPKKLRQMKFAAELYATKHKELNLRLAVAKTSGSPPVLDELIFLD